LPWFLVGLIVVTAPNHVQIGLRTVIARVFKIEKKHDGKYAIGNYQVLKQFQIYIRRSTNEL